MKPVYLAFFGSLIFAASFSTEAAAQNTCLQQCENTYATCLRNCESTKDTPQAKPCVDSCFRGHDGCKKRCGSKGSLDDVLRHVAAEKVVPAASPWRRASAPSAIDGSGATFSSDRVR